MIKKPAVARALFGGHRGFDVDTALRVVVGVFWQRSFEANSFEVLSHAMGLSRSSLYVCFGSTHTLLMGDTQLVALAQAHTVRVGALMTATLRRLGCAEDEASERAGALLALVMGIMALRKTGVSPSQLEASMSTPPRLRLSS